MQRQGTDIRAVMKRRSALLSRWVHYHSGNLIMHMLSGKEGPSMNNASISMCMVCDDICATVMLVSRSQTFRLTAEGLE